MTGKVALFTGGASGIGLAAARAFAAAEAVVYVREGRLDYAFNNAGSLLPSLSAEWYSDAFQNCMDINVTGVMRCM
jgi:NAD(P)-dependent dehydrogenase (short-subunit alcohol dehydrogenase family)